MYENLTVGRPVTHYSLEKTVCSYHSSFKSYRRKRPTLLRPEIVHFSRPPAFYPYILFAESYCRPSSIYRQYFGSSQSICLKDHLTILWHHISESSLLWLGLVKYSFERSIDNTSARANQAFI